MQVLGRVVQLGPSFVIAAAPMTQGRIKEAEELEDQAVFCLLLDCTMQSMLDGV